MPTRPIAQTTTDYKLSHVYVGGNAGLELKYTYLIKLLVIKILALLIKFANSAKISVHQIF